jgi:hypothetical protein
VFTLSKYVVDLNIQLDIKIMTNLLVNSEVLETSLLVGKRISAQGWHYDNSGSIAGIITEVTGPDYQNEYNVHVNPLNELSMRSMNFTAKNIQTLLLNGKLPKANSFCNTGVDAEILN